MRIYSIKEKKNLQVIVRVELYKRKNKLLKYIAENLIYFLHGASTRDPVGFAERTSSFLVYKVIADFLGRMF